MQRIRELTVALVGKHFTVSASASAAADSLNAMLKPILQAVPEASSGRRDPGVLSGGIQVQHIRFGYDADAPVLHDLSLEVRRANS